MERIEDKAEKIRKISNIEEICSENRQGIALDFGETKFYNLAKKLDRCKACQNYYEDYYRRYCRVIEK